MRLGADGLTALADWPTQAPSWNLSEQAGYLALLDRTQAEGSIDADGIVPPTPEADVDRETRGWRRPLNWLRSIRQFFVALTFSSLTRRIVSLNLAGLIALVASILYLSQFRAGLIDARAQSLLTQAEIIAGAIAAQATVETNTITIDPDRLLDLKPGETYGAPEESRGSIFPSIPNAWPRCCGG